MSYIDPLANKDIAPYLDWKEKPARPTEPKVDNIISKIVGQKIYAQDPRLLKLIIKWKQGKSQDSMEPDNFLDDPKKIAELKKVLSQKL
jgi:hypothetical protein